MYDKAKWKARQPSGKGSTWLLNMGYEVAPGKYAATIERFKTNPLSTYCNAFDPKGQSIRSGAMANMTVEDAQAWCAKVMDLGGSQSR